MSSASNASEHRVWIDGELVSPDQATVPVLSSAVFRGTSVFDVMAIVETDDGPAAVGLAEHVERFERSMALMSMTPACGFAELVAAVNAVVADQPGCGIVRMVALWGHSPGELPVDRTPSIVIAAEATGAPSPAQVRLRSATAKIPATVLPPGLKIAASYAPALRATLEAQQEGFDGVINRNGAGDLLEGISNSVGIVHGETIILPTLDEVLDSVTRRIVVQTAEALGFEVEVRHVPWSDVEQADAAFVSSTTKPVVGVAQIDHLVLNPAHATVEALRTAVDQILANEHQLSSTWLTPVGRGN